MAVPRHAATPQRARSLATKGTKITKDSFVIFVIFVAKTFVAVVAKLLDADDAGGPEDGGRHIHGVVA